MPILFFQITAAYSNAMLVAVMPYFSNCAKTLNLPTPLPVTQEQVWRFNCFPRSDHIGGRVILTNGCEFIFDHGHVENFVSPRSFFYLQNPDLIPKFYGPVRISESQALQIANNAIKKLGYTDAMLSDKPPEITPPKRDGTHYIARYLIRWRDTARGNPNDPPTSAEFEEDATSGQIVMLNIVNPNTYRPDLILDVHPPVVRQFGGGSFGKPTGKGRAVTPVTSAYALAFLNAILPELSDYVSKGNLTVKAPATVGDVDMARYLAKYNCGVIDGDTMAYIDTKTGTRFIYRHGQVIAFYASDARDNPERKRPMTYPGIDKEQAKFFGPINMTKDEAVDLVRQTVKDLGYSDSTLHMDELPSVSGPGWWGTNRIARCFIVWREGADGTTYANAEVDMADKTLKSLYINDDAVTNIWREPPKISN